MINTIELKLYQAFAFMADRASEPSTWQGVSFILGLLGSHYANLDWGQAAALGATLSGLLKIFTPDTKDTDDETKK
jgi:hypothetical protein